MAQNGKEAWAGLDPAQAFVYLVSRRDDPFRSRKLTARKRTALTPKPMRRRPPLREMSKLGILLNRPIVPPLMRAANAPCGVTFSFSL